MQDLFKRELKVGDRVIYTRKSYGSMCLSSASLAYGIVTKVTEKSATIAKPIKTRGGRIKPSTSRKETNKLIANGAGPQSWNVVIINKFPTELIQSLSIKE